MDSQIVSHENDRIKKLTTNIPSEIAFNTIHTLGYNDIYNLGFLVLKRRWLQNFILRHVFCFFKSRFVSSRATMSLKIPYDYQKTQRFYADFKSVKPFCKNVKIVVPYCSVHTARCRIQAKQSNKHWRQMFLFTKLRRKGKQLRKLQVSREYLFNLKSLGACSN
jgi:hypothetical protein